MMPSSFTPRRENFLNTLSKCQKLRWKQERNADAAMAKAKKKILKVNA